MIDCWLVGKSCPVVTMALPLEIALSTVCFHGAIVDIEEVFRGRLWGEVLSVGTQYSTKAPKCGGDFPTRLIERSIPQR